MVTPQTRSLLSAAISAADHGYFGDAQLLLSDALVAEYAVEIALAIAAIERRETNCRSLDLRPELHSLFAASQSSTIVETSAATPTAGTPVAIGDEFWSEIVIDFDEWADGGADATQGDITPASEAAELISPSLSQPNIEPALLERQASSRARYVAMSPAPPPPSHRRSTRNPTTEPGLFRADDVLPSSGVQHSDEPFTTQQRSSSKRVATVPAASIDSGHLSDDSMDWSDEAISLPSTTANAPHEPTPLNLRQQAATPFLASAVVHDSARQTDSSVHRASDRDTVMVEAVVDSVSEDTERPDSPVEEVTSTVPLDTQVSEPTTQPELVSSTAAVEPDAAPDSEAGSKAAMTASTPDAHAVSTAEVQPEKLHRPEFQTDERSARFQVAPSQSANRHVSTERTSRHIHSGVDSAESLPPTREVLGGTLAPRPADLTAELKLLGRRILKRNVKSLQAARSSLTPRTMFLLDQIDDLSSVEDIVDVTGLPAHEAYTLIRQLVDQGLVYFD